MTLKQLCKEYLLLEQKQDLLNFLLVYDLDNLDLQIKMLKICHCIKEVKNKMREELI